MEKLTQQQQEAVKKMSTDRLRLKLMTAGYEEQAVLGLERPNLMNTFAELLATGKVTPVGAAAAPVLAYDPELEKQKLIFEQKKWETEREDRIKKEKQEMEMKEKQFQLEVKQLAVRELELASENARKDSSAAKGKLFGDAMRASAIRMGPDVLDAIPFFKNVETLFQVYGVQRF